MPFHLVAIHHFNFEIYTIITFRDITEDSYILQLVKDDGKRIGFVLMLFYSFGKDHLYIYQFR